MNPEETYDNNKLLNLFTQKRDKLLKIEEDRIRKDLAQTKIDMYNYFANANTTSKCFHIEYEPKYVADKHDDIRYRTTYWNLFHGLGSELKNKGFDVTFEENYYSKGMVGWNH